MNTRYGEPEESLIQFDLTVDHREGEDDDDISLIVVKKDGKSYRAKWELRKANEQNLATQGNQLIARGSDSDHIQVPSNQRKSLKLQIQEQIQSIIVSETSSSKSLIKPVDRTEI